MQLTSRLSSWKPAGRLTSIDMQVHLTKKALVLRDKYEVRTFFKEKQIYFIQYHINPCYSAAVGNDLSIHSWAYTLAVLLGGSEQFGEPARSRLLHCNWVGSRMALAQVKTFLIMALDILSSSLLVVGIWSSISSTAALLSARLDGFCLFSCPHARWKSELSMW